MLSKIKSVSISMSIMSLSVLSACSMAPKYQQPNVIVAPNFPDSGMNVAEASISATNLGWQEYFADPRLHRLIELALNNNKDLRIAALNVEAVRAQYAIARSSQLPSIGVTGTGTKARVAEDLSTAGRSFIT